MNVDGLYVSAGAVVIYLVFVAYKQRTKPRHEHDGIDSFDPDESSNGLAPIPSRVDLPSDSRPDPKGDPVNLVRVLVQSRVPSLTHSNGAAETSPEEERKRQQMNETTPEEKQRRQMRVR